MIEIGIGSGYLKWRVDMFAKVFLRITLLLGAKYFDSAPLYGDGRGEKLTGFVVGKSGRLITKVGLTSEVGFEGNAIERWEEHFSPVKLARCLDESLSRLGVSKIYGYLLHATNASYNYEKHILVLEQLKCQGKTEKIGFSADSAIDLPTSYGWADIVQVPANALQFVTLEDWQIVLVNRVFRVSEGKRHLKEFVYANPTASIVVLVGTSNIIRLLSALVYIRQLRKLQGFHNL